MEEQVIKTADEMGRRTHKIVDLATTKIDKLERHGHPVTMENVVHYVAYNIDFYAPLPVIKYIVGLYWNL